MREIKVRAWDKIDKNMLAVLQVDWVEKSIVIPKPVLVNDGDIDFSFDKRRFQDIELMQYTGLKDKNGKEIYEGDILKYWYDRDKTGDSRVEFTEIVEFEEMAEYNGWSFHKNLNPEVIGNIYENKEEL